MFIAIDHEGDASPYTRLRKGITPLAKPMGIGGTWNLKRAYEVGEVTGVELAAAGINFLLGPSIDVLNTLGLTRRGDFANSPPPFPFTRKAYAPFGEKRV